MEEKTTALVPFGKYKGQPVEQLLADQPYLEWLTSQDWFRQKYQNIYAVIINYPGKPTETPAHNQMQVKFLSREYQLKLAVFLLGTDLFKWNQSHFDQNIGALLDTACREHAKQFGNAVSLIGKLKQALLRLDGLRLIRITSPVFEDRGTDVSYEISCGYGQFFDSQDNEFWYAPEFFRALWKFSTDVSLRIELKPTVGDDFPAVLRQIKSDKSNVLVLRAYTGTGASWDAFVEYFLSQGIRVVMETDIDAITLPSFDKTLTVKFENLGLLH
jgi:hypothetical protein